MHRLSSRLSSHHLCAQTAVAEGLAQRIVSNDVPEALQGRTLMALDMGALIAGKQPCIHAHASHLLRPHPHPSF